MKNRIAFITIHVGQNFGSILQTIATSEFFKKLGYSPIVVNYVPDRVTIGRYWRDARTSITKFIWRLIYFPVYIVNKKIYNGYLVKYCNLSKPIYDTDVFSKKCPIADYYVTGSDQVWNTTWNEGFDIHYFFPGIKADKISFASSIGALRPKEEDLQKLYNHLCDYSAISVRENSARDALESVGIKSERLFDPTFLLNRDEWKNYMSKKVISDPYVLVYVPYNIIDKNEIFYTARLLSKECNLKVVAFSWNTRNENLADRTVKFASPGDFLSLMYYADYVITNSFHGTAFSINLHKQFWVFLPSGFATRIESLLADCELEGRIVSASKDVRLKEQIDFDKVEKILSQERVKSEIFIRRALDVSKN